jgi:hypothetical protein
LSEDAGESEERNEDEDGTLSLNCVHARRFHASSLT